MRKRTTSRAKETIKEATTKATEAVKETVEKTTVKASEVMTNFMHLVRRRTMILKR